MRLYIEWKILFTTASPENTNASTTAIPIPFTISDIEYSVYSIRLLSLKPVTKLLPISFRDGNSSSGNACI